MSAMSAEFDPQIHYYPPSIAAKYGLESHQDDASNPAVPTADISWQPDWAKFQQRSASRSPSSVQENTLPSGWPKQLDGSLVWSGADLQASDYVVELTGVEIEEIEQALSSFKKLHVDLQSLCRSNFPLPTLSSRLESSGAEIHSGRGFCVLRGIDSKGHSLEDNEIIYLGIASYFGQERGRQYQNGQLMSHVADVKFDNVADDQRRPLFTNWPQPFHTDMLCGILGMYYLNCAASGGETLLASSWKVYNEIASERPDLIGVLSSPDWVHDTFGRNPAYHKRALLHHWHSKMILIFSRRNLTGSDATPRTQGIPPMTDIQAEALDWLHFTALRHSVTIRARPGDMLFVNNLAVMHSRKAFRDSGAAQRYMLRLWLNNPELCWEIPPGLRLPWDRVFAPVEEIMDHFVDRPYDSNDEGYHSSEVQSNTRYFKAPGMSTGQSSSCG